MINILILGNFPGLGLLRRRESLTVVRFHIDCHCKALHLLEYTMLLKGVHEVDFIWNNFTVRGHYIMKHETGTVMARVA